MRKSKGLGLSSGRRALTTSDRPRRLRWTGTVKEVDGRRDERERWELTNTTDTSSMSRTSAEAAPSPPSLPPPLTGGGKAAPNAISTSYDMTDEDREVVEGDR